MAAQTNRIRASLKQYYQSPINNNRVAIALYLLLVTELFDSGKVQMAQRAYQGILEILASDVFITRCMTQNVRHPGLSHLFHQILSHGYGSSIYIRTFELFVGSRFGDLASACPKAVLLGVVRPHGDVFHSMLNPPGNLTLESADRLVFLAREYEDCELLKNPVAETITASISEGASHSCEGQTTYLNFGLES